MTGRLAVFLPEGDASRQPAVYTLLQLLAQSGYAIDLFSETPVLPLDVTLEGVTAFCAPAKVSNSLSRRLGQRLMQRSPLVVRAARLRNVVRRALGKAKEPFSSALREASDPRLFVASSNLIELVDSTVAGASYDAAIGMGEAGAVLAHHSVPGALLLYYSLELFYEGHPEMGGHRFRRIKAVERELFSHVDAVIIQDEERARRLWQDMGYLYQPEKVLTFPTSYLGSAGYLRSDLLRRRLPELGDRKILLQWGSTSKARRTDELLRASRACPPDLAMVFHGRIGSDCADELPKAQCWISKPDLPREVVADLVASSDIGIIFYQENNENDGIIAHASGQLSLFLKCGIPVIVDNKPSLRRLVDTYGCGVVVQGADEVFQAARTILSSYDSYSEGALACFEAEHNLESHFQSIMEFMKTPSSQDEVRIGAAAS
jgi:glycosyltransferase involved in cell wall biosynthesis